MPMNDVIRVDWETAKLLKERGFKEPVNAFLGPSGKVWTSTMPEDHNEYAAEEEGKDYYSCPSIDMVIRWLWEKHKYSIQADWMYVNRPEETGDMSTQFYYVITSPVHPNEEWSEDDGVWFETIEEAQAAGVKFCLTNFIQKI